MPFSSFVGDEVVGGGRKECVISLFSPELDIKFNNSSSSSSSNIRY